MVRLKAILLHSANSAHVGETFDGSGGEDGLGKEKHESEQGFHGDDAQGREPACIIPAPTVPAMRFFAPQLRQFAVNCMMRIACPALFVSAEMRRVSACLPGFSPVPSMTVQQTKPRSTQRCACSTRPPGAG